MKIGDLAREGGVSVETIRFYQRRGLLSEPPRAGGARRYSEGDLERLRSIRAAQTAGFTLEEIATLLALDHDDRSAARAGRGPDRRDRREDRHSQDNARGAQGSRAGLHARGRRAVPDPRGVPPSAQTQTA